MLLKAISQISNVLNEIDNLKKNVDIAKVQFILSNKGKWKFNYLLTADGKSIGKKSTIKKREKRNEIILKNASNAGHPVSVSTGISIKSAKTGKRIFE